jgi:hypothetical protein
LEEVYYSRVGRSAQVLPRAIASKSQHRIGPHRRAGENPMLSGALDVDGDDRRHYGRAAGYTTWLYCVLARRLGPTWPVNLVGELGR